MWYRTFKKSEDGWSLQNSYGKRLKTMVVVSKPTPPYGYQYAAFDNYVHLYNYIMSLSPKDRIFHEIPLHNTLQKPRFDIDIEDSCSKDFMSIGHIVRDKLLLRIAAEFNKIGVTFSPERNLLIYNTHRKNKYSSHIIVAGLVHSCARQAKEFYLRVTEGDEQLQMFVDKAVYDKNHSLRMLHCCKLGTGEAKVLEDGVVFDGVKYEHTYKFEFDDDTHKAIYQFSESLISHSSTCYIIPDYDIEDSKIDSHPLLDEERSEMEKLLYKHFGDDPPFVPSGYEGNFMWLKRLKPSYCEFCERVHQKMGPMVYVINGSVFWHCRRNGDKKKRLFLGTITSKSVTTSFFSNHFEEDEQQEQREEEKKVIVPRENRKARKLVKDNLSITRANRDELIRISRGLK